MLVALRLWPSLQNGGALLEKVMVGTFLLFIV